MEFLVGFLRHEAPSFVPEALEVLKVPFVPIFLGRIFSSISNHEAKKGGKFIVLKAVA